MSKSILVIDTPKSCEECKCSMTTFGKLHCPPRDTVVRKGERDCACPLKPVPEEIDPVKAKCDSGASWIKGWNACVEKITGK